MEKVDEVVFAAQISFENSRSFDVTLSLLLTPIDILRSLVYRNADSIAFKMKRKRFADIYHIEAK